MSNEEMGMFWRDTELSFWWYRAPIETQAMMIEAFAEVMDDAAGGRGLQGLAAQAEADAGLEDDQGHRRRRLRPLAPRREPAQVRRAGRSDARRRQTIKPEKVEAGTGFYEQKFVRGEVKPAMGDHHASRRPTRASRWGSVHWQYLEDISKVTPHEGTPLKLTKTLFRRAMYTKNGPVLEPVKRPDRGRRRGGGPHRAAHRPRHGVRPPEGPPRQRHRAGERALAVQVPGRPGLLREHRDTASHFFIDYLPKGVYVFEYAVAGATEGPVPDRHRGHPVHVRPGIQQPLGEYLD